MYLEITSHDIKFSRFPNSDACFSISGGKVRIYCNVDNMRNSDLTKLISNITKLDFGHIREYLEREHYGQHLLIYNISSTLEKAYMGVGGIADHLSELFGYSEVLLSFYIDGLEHWDD